MSLIDQALTTMAEVRRYLKLYTMTTVTSSETLTADTGAVTFSFAYTDVALNSLGTVKQITSAGVTATLTASQYAIDYVNGTLTFTAAMTGSITVSDYDYFAWDYSKDNQIERLINGASDSISKHCNRKFIADTYSEFYKGSGRQKLILNQYPVNSITSVKVDSAALTAGTDYVTSDQTYLDEGIIFKNNGWTWYGYLTGLVGELTAPVDNIEVVYSAGYTLEPEASRTLPYDLEEACISLVAVQYEMIGSKQLTRETIGPLTSDYIQSFPWDVKQTLEKYAKKVI
jgi:hypothetical protein